MNTIELSLSPSYVPHWGLKEAIREILANARDEELNGHDMHIAHVDGMLLVSSRGATLTRQSLLLGESVKAEGVGRRFGEGYKLACLVLCRMKRGITILSGAESWTPRIGRSENFGSDVLMFDIERGRTPTRHAVRFAVEVTDKEWSDTQWRCLWLSGQDEEKIEVESGTILLHPRRKRHLYHGGNFVCQLPDEYEHGYDLADVQLDRDRLVADPFSLSWELRNVWQQAIGGGKRASPLLVDSIEAGSRDIGHLSGDALGQDQLDSIAYAWRDKHGSAVPAAPADTALIQRAGRKAIVVEGPGLEVLRAAVGGAESFEGTVDSTWGRDSLGVDEARVLQRVGTLLDCDGTLVAAQFLDDTPTRLIGGRLHIARHLLGNFKNTLLAVARALGEADERLADIVERFTD